jgi:hypothetical protein
MLYTYGAELSEGIIVRTYLAKISGPDEQYRFKRSFLKWEYHRYQIQLWFTFEIDQGVYEQRMSGMIGAGLYSLMGSFIKSGVTKSCSAFLILICSPTSIQGKPDKSRKIKYLYSQRRSFYYQQIAKSRFKLY